MSIAASAGEQGAERVRDERSREEPTAWCDRCGRPLSDGGHESCERARELEPPRFCPHCRRRMVVQVTPAGWTARCSEHGELLPG